MLRSLFFTERRYRNLFQQNIFKKKLELLWSNYRLAISNGGLDSVFYSILDAPKSSALMYLHVSSINSSYVGVVKHRKKKTKLSQVMSYQVLLLILVLPEATKTKLRQRNRLSPLALTVTHMIRCESTREENSWNLRATKMKARTVVGRGKKSLLSDPGSELRLGREKEKGKVRR